MTSAIPASNHVATGRAVPGAPNRGRWPVTALALNWSLRWHSMQDIGNCRSSRFDALLDCLLIRPTSAITVRADTMRKVNSLKLA